MPNIAVSVCTYSRNDGLAALLGSLDRQRFRQLGDSEICLIVVDNSREAGAAELCAGWRGRFPIHFVHEPRKGLAAARNACLDAAHEIGATHIAFIDDDEMASPSWLEALFHRMEKAAAEAVLGPVAPVFEAPPPAWLPVEAFQKRAPLRNGFASEGYTCNAFLSMEAVKRFGLRFDQRFNETGGEDTALFGQLIARGGLIAWAEDALVYEVVPRCRMRAAWLWRRWYRTGTNEVHLRARGRISLASRALCAGRGVARLGYGAVRIAYALGAQSWRCPERLVASCYTAWRGAGFIAAALGSSYREYTRSDYR
jgi:glycosyltransferase involved in cell wall biosynthesis